MNIVKNGDFARNLSKISNSQNLSGHHPYFSVVLGLLNKNKICKRDKVRFSIGAE